MLTYLLVIFASPFYFLTRKKWVHFAISAILYALALLTILVGVGVFFWLVAALHAYFAYGKEREEGAWERQQQMMDDQATATAQRMAAVLLQQQQISSQGAKTPPPLPETDSSM